MTANILEALRPLALPLSNLTLDPANARRHPEANVEAIKASLVAYGQHRPAVAQRTMEGLVVRVGNGMVEAARALGWEEIAVVIVDEDDLRATGRAIADNRTADLAEWDDESLGALLAVLSKTELPTGFSEAEAEALLGAWGISPDASGLPGDLGAESKDFRQTLIFLHESQVPIWEEALRLASEAGRTYEDVNLNPTANAATAIAQAYIDSHG